MVQLSNGGSKTRREQRALATRETILRAAAGVFRARGFGATGMREIAEAANLSPANLYYYFKSKTDILFFCQDHSVERMLQETRGLERGDLQPADRLKQAITTHLLFTLDELDGAAAHTETDALPEPQRSAIVAKRDQYEQALRKIVSAGIRSGDFRAADPVLVTRAILGACNWTTRWYHPDGKLKPPAIAEAYADYLVGGLLK